MLATRILTACVLIPATLAALFLLPPLAWGAVTLLVIVLASAEWARLAGFARMDALAFITGVALIGMLLLFVRVSGFDRGWQPNVVAVVCGATVLFWVLVAPQWLRQRWKVRSPLLAGAVGWLVLLGAWVGLVQLQAQSGWRVLAALALVWIADTAAYFAGRALGRHKLAPSISPGKTWEGVIGGLLAVAVYAIALLVGGREHVAPGWGWMAGWFVLALGVAALSIVGDLFESRLKREAGVKDSGTLLPGHGGVLDRIDALLPAIPALALAAQYGLR